MMIPTTQMEITPRKQEKGTAITCLFTVILLLVIIVLLVIQAGNDCNRGGGFLLDCHVGYQMGIGTLPVKDAAEGHAPDRTCDKACTFMRIVRYFVVSILKAFLIPVSPLYNAIALYI